MKLTIVAILASALSFLPASAPCRAKDDPSLPIPDVLQPAVTAAESTGRQLQRLDRAAWVASDAIQADRDARKLRRSVRGWITEDTELGTRVTFFDDATPARLLYAVDVESSGRLTSGALPEDTLADDTQQAMIRARQSALSQDFMRCSRTYNTVAFRADGALHVYVMASTTKTGVYPAGGHHLFVYDAGGTRLESRRAFTNGCIDLETGSAPQAEGMLFITHLLDRQPTEIHVFVNLAAAVPLIVMTPSLDDPEEPAIWAVEQGRISLVDAGDDD
ncbi:MAG: hypothetical protein NVV60_14240 [Luteimonas sp.]|nr:hypothetical protein [Luteimonas sp.]